MASAAGYPTPYPGVNTVIKLLLENVQSVLDTYFIGLYLHGSLAIGDFEPGRSDIDFCVVTTRELPLKLINGLEVVHKRIKESGLEWANKLEGSYLSKKTLRRYSPGETPHPHVDNIKFQVTRDERDWVFNRHILREHGVVVAGPPIKPMIAPVNPDELREAVVLGLKEDWTSRLNDRQWAAPGAHQPYVVLTCCRALYTMKFGAITSKNVSAQWALTALDKEWTDLIQAALKWSERDPHGDIEKTQKMMRYTLEQAEPYRK